MKEYNNKKKFFSYFSNIIIILILSFLTNCGNPLVEKGDKEFEKDNYYKALKYYKEAYKEDPNNEEIFLKINKTYTNIIAKGMSFFYQKKYKKVLNYIKPLLDEILCPIEAYMLGTFAYFYSYPENPYQINEGFKLLNYALIKSTNKFYVKNLPKDCINWLIKNGLKREDIYGVAFNFRDVGVVYRAFLFYHIAQNIKKYDKVKFPLPKKWKKEEIEKLKEIYSIFYWIIHNIQVININNKLYYEALAPDILLRGYGTYEEISRCFIYLCFQNNVNAYLLQNNKNKHLVLVNIDKKFIILDFKNGIPLLDKNNNLLEIDNNILKNKNLEKSIIWVVIPPRTLIPRLYLLPKILASFKVYPPPYFYLSPYALGNRVKKLLLKNNNLKYDYLKPHINEKIYINFYPTPFKIWHKINLEKNFIKLIKTKKKYLLDKDIKEYRLKFLRYGKIDEEKYKKLKQKYNKGIEKDFIEYTYISYKLNLLDPKGEKLAKDYIKFKKFWYKSILFQLGRYYKRKGEIKKSRNIYKNTRIKENIKYY